MRGFTRLCVDYLYYIVRGNYNAHATMISVSAGVGKHEHWQYV